MKVLKMIAGFLLALLSIIGFILIIITVSIMVFKGVKAGLVIMMFILIPLEFLLIKLSRSLLRDFLKNLITKEPGLHINGYSYAGFWKSLLAVITALTITPIYSVWYLVGNMNYQSFELMRNFITKKPDLHITGYYYAGFWKRLLAIIIDLTILSPIFFIWYFVGNMNYQSFELSFWIGHLEIFYTFILVGKYGKTVGKKLVGIKVFKTCGSEVSYSHSIRRMAGSLVIYALYILDHILIVSRIDSSVLFGMRYSDINHKYSQLSSMNDWIFDIMFFWVICEIITLLLNKQKRSIHDFIGGTIVLNIKNKELPKEFEIEMVKDQKICQQ